jgi:hypothetical protein
MIRAKTLLRVFKYLAIIISVIGFFILWTSVPEDNLNETEVNHASEQSK